MQGDDSSPSAREANLQLEMVALIEQQAFIVDDLCPQLVEAQDYLYLDAVKLDDMKRLYEVIFAEIKAERDPNFMCSFSRRLLPSR